MSGPNLLFAFVVKLLVEASFDSFVHNGYGAFESSEDRPVVWEAQRCHIVVDLSQISASSEDAITPSWDASFLWGIVVVCADVETISWWKGDSALGIILEDHAGNHLDIQLVVLIQSFKITGTNQSASSIVW
jgi:hypothetical protein